MDSENIIKNKTINKSTSRKIGKEASKTSKDISKKRKSKPKIKQIGKINTLISKNYVPGAKRVIVVSNFNTFAFSDERFSKTWIKKRIAIFMTYTLKSLKLQTNQDFLALIKYEDKSKEIIEHELKKYSKLPENIKFVQRSEYEKIMKEQIRAFDYLYLVRLDSDDMYHKSYIQQMHDYKHDVTTEAIINQNGYIYDSINERIALFPQRSPNYYTLIYKVKDYINGKRYVIPGGHPNVIKLLNYEIIRKPNYIRNIHSANDSSTFRLARKNKVFYDTEKVKKILSEFM